MPIVSPSSRHARAFRPLLTLFSSLALMACGGGGGGGSNSAPPPPLMPLNASNTTPSFGSTFSLSDFSDFIGWEGFIAALRIGGPSMTQEMPCPSGGSNRAALVDNDQSQGLTVNDRITITITACRVGSTTLDGQLEIDMREVQGGFVSAQQVLPYASDASMVYRVTISRYSQTNGQSLFTASGAVDAEFRTNPTQDHLITTVDRINTMLSRDTQSQTVELRNYRKDRLLDYSLRTYRISMNGEIHVDAPPLLGYYTFDTGTGETATPLTGSMNSFPGSGKLTLRGANNSYMRLEGRSSSSTAALFLSPTVAGGAEQQTQIVWSSIAATALFRPLRTGYGASVVQFEPFTGSSRAQMQSPPAFDTADFLSSPEGRY